MIKPKIVFLLQTPPPFHGQSIMQKYLVDYDLNWCIKKHIKMNFSGEISHIGKFQFIKIIRAFKIIFIVFKERLMGKIDLIYYPPSSPQKIPFYRDILILMFIRLFTKKIIFHFHAGGFDILYNSLNHIEKFIAKLVYHKPEASIVLSKMQEKEIKWINSKKTYIVNNGLPDEAPNIIYEKKNSDVLRILFVSNLVEEKGIIDCVEAFNILYKTYKNIKLIVVGGWQSNELKQKLNNYLNTQNIRNVVQFTDSKYNQEKFIHFINGDIFCLPTYAFESSSLSLIEALMFSLPIVSTKWRVIPEFVCDGENGFLVSIKKPEELADKLKILIDNNELRNKMGRKGREKYLENFTLKKHLDNIEIILKEILFN